MKTKKLKLLAILLFLLPLCMAILGTGCEEENINPDPDRAILGKWEVIENSLGPVSYPGAYEEYGTDSVLFNYNSENDTNYSKYWFVDSLLYKSHEYIIIEGYDTTIYADIQSYKFEFLTYNKLQLEFQNPAIVNWVIYKRIK